eukprot:scaffold2553_cov138-Cylindrotheca_fusiformis.AAC.20
MQSPLQFSRDFVQCSRPCIIRNAFLDDGGNPLLMTLDDICDVLDRDETILSVDVTPDGHGDSVRTLNDGSKLFVQPSECDMTLREFTRRLRRPRPSNNGEATKLDSNGRPIVKMCDKVLDEKVTEVSLPADSVVYYSRQNDCLRKEIPKLKDHFPSRIAWVEEALGASQPLDAVNLWMGDELATSSMHKDHYENLFYVASGEKIFTVCPPPAVAFLYEHREYGRGVFQVQEASCQWEVTPIADGTKVHWIAPDVALLQSENGSVLTEQYPLLQHVHPLEIRVQAGDMLYLPSLWFHRVTQSCETVGINYWYEMRFDSPLWCYFSFLQQLQHCNDNDENDE